jgi:hypothetical protein
MSKPAASLDGLRDGGRRGGEDWSGSATPNVSNEGSRRDHFDALRERSSGGPMIWTSTIY